MSALHSNSQLVLDDEHVTGTSEGSNELPPKTQAFLPNRVDMFKMESNPETMARVPETKETVDQAEGLGKEGNYDERVQLNGGDENNPTGGINILFPISGKQDVTKVGNQVLHPSCVRKTFELKDNLQPSRISMLINDYGIMFDQYQTLALLMETNKGTLEDKSLQTKVNQIKREMSRKLMEIEEVSKGIRRYEEENYITIPKFGKEEKVDMKAIHALPIFDPKDAPPTLKEFWQKISHYIEIAELTEKAAKLLLQFLLSGDAHDVFEMNKEKPIEEIIRSLKESFGGFPSHMEFEEQMNNFRRGRNESLKAAMNRYEFIINQMYKNQNDVHNILELKCKNMVKSIAMKEALERLERSEMRNSGMEFKYQDRLKFLSREEDILLKRNGPQANSFIVDDEEYLSSDHEEESDPELIIDDYEEDQPEDLTINNTEADFHDYAQEPMASYEYEDYDPYNSALHPTINLLAEYETIRSLREAERKLPTRFIQMEDGYYERRPATNDPTTYEDGFQQNQEEPQDEHERGSDLRDYNDEPVPHEVVINSLKMENAQLKRELELREIVQPFLNWSEQQNH